MKPGILKALDIEEFFTNERCYIGEIYNEDEDASHSLARTRVLPGIQTALHSLKDTTELYFILRGEGLMEVGQEEPMKVGPGDTIRIPANVSQRITNTGTEDLYFLCVCAPAFRPECYQDLEALRNK